MIATIPTWLVMTILKDELDVAPTASNMKQEKKETNAALVTALDKSAADARGAIEKTTDEHLMTSWRLLAGGNPATIRRFEEQDEPAVVDVWFRSGKAAYPFLQLWQTLTWPQAAEIFRTEIRSRCDIWVAVKNGQVVGYLAVRPPSYVDRLYVDPKAQRNNIGTMLLDFAKSISPGGLRLHTHQQNMPAREFYEKHRFQAVRLSISPPPESAPDVEYHWKGRDQQDL